MTVSLDAIVIDCTDCTDLPATVQTIHFNIGYRLRCANLGDNSDIAFIAHPRVIKQFPSDYPIRLVRSDRLGNTGYLLTKSSGGQKFIMPPNGMSWDDYFLPIYTGMIIISAPWAQARFENLDKMI